METMFRATALDRALLNMNVLDATRTPLVMSLQGVLRACDHRHEVLIRRSNHRLAAIERRIEILTATCWLSERDEVIRIIRNEDDRRIRLRAIQTDRCAGRAISTCACGRCAGSRWRS